MRTVITAVVLAGALCACASPPQQQQPDATPAPVTTAAGTPVTTAARTPPTRATPPPTTAGVSGFGMPNVVGLSFSDAQTLLEYAGIDVAAVVVLYREHNAATADMVFRQEPRPGRSAGGTQEIKLFVAKAAAEDRTAEPQTETAAEDRTAEPQTETAAEDRTAEPQTETAAEDRTAEPQTEAAAPLVWLAAQGYEVPADTFAVLPDDGECGQRTGRSAGGCVAPATIGGLFHIHTNYEPGTPRYEIVLTHELVHVWQAMQADANAWRCNPARLVTRPEWHNHWPAEGDTQICVLTACPLGGIRQIEREATEVSNRYTAEWHSSDVGLIDVGAYLALLPTYEEECAQ